MLSKFRVGLACVVALLAGVVRAATINVGPGQTYTTIQVGINAAQNGDTVLVAPGTYYENIDFKGKAITVTSTSGPTGGAANTTIDGGMAGSTVTFKSGEPRTAILSGFTITDGGSVYSSDENLGSGITVLYSQPTLLDNIITANYCRGIDVESSAPLIQGNTISNSLTPNSCEVTTGGGIYVFSSLLASLGTNTTVIVGNTIEGNTTGEFGDGGGDGGGGIQDWGNVSLIANNIIRNNIARSGDGGGIYLDEYGHIAVVQNLIYGNSAGCGGGGIAYDGGGEVATAIFIANNTLVNNTNYTGGGGYSECQQSAQIYSDLYGESGPSVAFVNNIFSGDTSYPSLACEEFNIGSTSEAFQPVFDHNIVYNSGSGGFFGSSCIDVSAKYGNVVADPGFVDPTNGNFALHTGSPAIDAGNNSVIGLLSSSYNYQLTTDLAGNARPQDATGKGYPVIDIGAYEFEGTSDAQPTSVVLTPSSYTGNAGQYTLTATLSSALGSPTGSVMFFVDGKQVGAAVISGGVATLQNVLLTPGVHNLLATYGGQGSFPAAQSIVVIVEISLYTTSITLNSTPNPSVSGQTVTFSVHVASSDSSYIPTPVTLQEGSTTLATLTPDSSGNASFSVATLALGYDYITASYAGDSLHASASAGVVQDVITGYPTTTSISGAPNPSVVGQSVTFTATVSMLVTGEGAPQGSVVFADGATTLGTEPVGATTGTAVFATSSLALGNHNITATYQPLNAFAGSTGTVEQQVVTGYGTTTSLVSSVNPAVPGQSVTFTAMVTAANAANGTPTGSVVFSDGNTVEETVPFTGSPVVWTTSTLPNGTDDIVAKFVPTGDFSLSDGELLETVGYSTATTTTDSPEPSTYGQPVVFSAHVAGVAGSVGVPTGYVIFEYCHGAEVRLALDANGNVSYTSPVAGAVSEPVGSCPYTANYLGDANFLPSVSGSTAYVVNPANSATSVGGTPNPGYVGQAVTLTAQVQGTPSPTLGPGGVILQPGSTVATGTVQFYDGATPVGGAVALSATQTAAVSTSALTPGTHTLTAKYSGDANLDGSTSTVALEETIVLATTSTTLIATPNPVYQNQTETIAATVAAIDGPAAPAGEVAIYDGANLLTTLPLMSAPGAISSASFTTSTLAVGTHSLTAVYTPGCSAAVICGVLGFTGSQSGVVSLVVEPQDFTITANPPSITIQTEYHKSMALTLTSIGGFAAKISLECLGTVPEWVSCSFPGAPVYLAGTANATVPVTLTIDTDALQDYKSETSGMGSRMVLAGFLPLMLFGFLRKRRWRGLVLVAIASVMAMSVTACSGHYPAHAEPGTYTVTVQASGQTAGASAPTVHTMDVTLVVTP